MFFMTIRGRQTVLKRRRSLTGKSDMMKHHPRIHRQVKVKPTNISELEVRLSTSVRYTAADQILSGDATDEGV